LLISGIKLVRGEDTYIEPLIKEIKRRKPQFDESKATELANKILQSHLSEDNAILVRLAIGEIIKEKCGISDYSEYIVELAAGKAT
jgi:imidazoleglycerol phosphate dehydratase HisB